MEIKVLGAGCAKCKQLYEQTEKAVQELGVAARLIKVDKINDIMAYRVLMTPALVINEEVKVAGRIPSTAELTTWLAAAAAHEESR